MAFEHCTLTSEQHALLQVTAQLVDCRPDGAYSEGLLRGIFPDLTTSGLGPEIDDQDWPPPALASPEFAAQVRRSRKLFHGLQKASRMNSKAHAWSLAQNIGHKSKQPICTGALIVGAAMEGFTISRSRYGTGASNINITTASLAELWERVG